MQKRVSPPGSGIHAIPETDMHDPERDIRDIPLSQLELSPGNVRKTPADASAFTELKASIVSPRAAREPDCPRHGTRHGWPRALRGDRRRPAACRDADAGRRRRAGRGPPRALPHDRKLSWRPKKFRWPRTVSAPPCTRPIRSRRSAAWPMRAARQPPSRRALGSRNAPWRSGCGSATPHRCCWRPTARARSIWKH